MAQKQSPEKQVEELLQTIDPSKFADESLRHTLTVLLNVIEQQQLEIRELREENQKLRDENNRLKGEQGKPEIKSNKQKGFKSNHSSEKERHNPKKHTKSSKNQNIKVDRTSILDYPASELPDDAQFKGYEEVIIQDIALKTDNVLFRKEKYYLPSQGKTYLASLPPGYDGEFGPGIKALVMSLYYGGNMTQETVLSELEFNSLLDTYLSKLGSQYRTRVLEAAAISFYHQQSEIPVVEFLVCDDAPQFKLITDNLALCWVHEARHYKKLSPFVGFYQQTLDKFLGEFWDYYRELLAYRDSPSPETKQELKTKFCQLFATETGYKQLDERKKLTAAKESELLLVLSYPELPLHNNPAELAARTMVQRRKISYATQTSEGTKAWDIFMSLVATTRKLGISFFEYIHDRISLCCQIPELDTIIRSKFSINPQTL